MRALQLKLRKAISDPHAVGLYLRNIMQKLMASPSKEEIFVGLSENRSLSQYGDYVAFVTRAARDPRVFSTFKADPSYTSVLEHVAPEVGEKYLRIIEERTPELLDLIDRFKLNDRVGTPFTHSYPQVGAISPTTLRYMKVASDLKKYFGPEIGEKIAEIGVGYGGQLLVSDQVFRIKQWDLFDLPPVLDLAERYLETHILNCGYKTTTLNRSAGDERYDLVVSNYAFSELPAQLQSKYIEKILSKSSKGYLTMNSGMEGTAFRGNILSIDVLRQKLPTFEILPEVPSTGPNNYIIVWGHQ